jgi:hypothetical protein
VCALPAKAAVVAQSGTGSVESRAAEVRRSAIVTFSWVLV